MIQLDNIKSLAHHASLPETIIFYVFNKEKEEYRFIDKYTISSQFINISTIREEYKLFNKYDIYRIESMEEYEKLVYLKELIG